MNRRLISLAAIACVTALVAFLVARSRSARTTAVAPVHENRAPRATVDVAEPASVDATRRAAAPANSPAVPAPERATILAPIAKFDQWLDLHRPNLAAPPATVVEEGRTLAAARRTALKALIPLDPREAIAHRIPAANRAGLPAAILAELEQPVDAYGDLEVISICDPSAPRVDRWATIAGKMYATYTYGQRLHTLTKNRIAVHGIAIDDTLAMSDTPYRALDPGEQSVATDRGDTVQVISGTDRKAFPSRAELDAWMSDVATAEQKIDPYALSGPATTAAATAAGWTTGEKTVLWIRAEFSDDPGSPATDDQINSAMASVSTFYQDISKNTCSFKTTIVPDTMKLATPKSVYATSATTYVTLRNDALQMARSYDAANGGTGLYNPDNYDRYIVIFKNVSTYTWSGIATVGAKGLSLNGTASAAVTGHELGHNHGLHHSHAWTPSTSSAIGAGTHMEYGDAFDDMGSGQSGDYLGHFNTAQKYLLGYLPTDAIQTVTKSGTYRIYRHDDRNASGVRALKVASTWAGTNYWIEYRHNAPYPLFAAPAIGPSELARLQNGIVVHWDLGPSFTTGLGTYLLDMTPTTTSGVPIPSDYSGISHLLDDSALALGESFTDSALGMIVTPVATGGTSPNEWIDVYVSVGPTTGNQSPTVAASTAATFVARTDVTFNASATDPDGDAVYYHWDFGDNTIAPATANVTHRWLKGGTYTVRCTALDGRGGSATTTLTVTVDDPLLTWQRQASSLTPNYFYNVIFDGTQFVAVGAFVGAVSKDGVQWTLGTGMTNANYNYAVAHGNGRYVAVGRTSGSTPTAASITSSTDALKWSDESPSNGIPELDDIVFAVGRFVAVGRSGTILTSSDGLAWTKISNARANDLLRVAYGGGRFVATGASGTYLTSTDGITWQDVSLANDPTAAYGLLYYQGKWLAITSYYSSDSTKRIAWSSADGMAWSKMYLDVNSSMYGPVAVANSNLLLGVSRANDGRIFFAETPYDWEAASVIPDSPLTSTSNLLSAAEGNGTIVVVGLAGQIYTPVGKPAIVSQATAQSILAGQSITLASQAYATGPFTYQWKKDGAAISGATNATLTLSSTAPSDTGTYTVVVQNATGSTTATIAQLVVNSLTDAGRITNMSIRSQAGTGSETLIVGVTVAGGDGSKKPLLMRATGPSLAAYGVAGTLVDPVLTVVHDGTIVLTNDNWNGDPQIVSVGNSVGAFPMASTDSRDAALYASLAPGGYSMQVTSNAGPGVALVEVYDATLSGSYTTATPRLTNVSARTRVGTGDDVLIAGFAIGGSSAKRLLIRGIGPSLTEYGVDGALADPKLELYRQEGGGVSTKLSENDNWNFDPTTEATADSVGAFKLKSANDAVLIQALPPGLYSVVVKGINNTTGVGMVEVYELP